MIEIYQGAALNVSLIIAEDLLWNGTSFVNLIH